jgi:cytochrome c oxidase cbb3-type subunit 4
MDSINDMRAAITVISFLVFIGICVWAWSARRKSKFDEAARLPLDEEHPQPASNNATVEKRSGNE